MKLVKKKVSRIKVGEHIVTDNFSSDYGKVTRIAEDEDNVVGDERLLIISLKGKRRITLGEYEDVIVVQE